MLVCFIFQSKTLVFAPARYIYFPFVMLFFEYKKHTIDKIKIKNAYAQSSGENGLRGWYIGPALSLLRIVGSGLFFLLLCFRFLFFCMKTLDSLSDYDGNFIQTYSVAIKWYFICTYKSLLTLYTVSLVKWE